MVIKAIETWYAHCRFRSKLEARFAVLFDHLDWPWQYEPQGWHLGNDECYLPDFWLPTLNAYLEVKGMWDHTVRKAQRFAQAEIEEHAVYLAVGGIPGHRQLASVGWWEPDQPCGVTNLTPAFDWDSWAPAGSDAVVAACEAARSARFDTRERRRLVA